MPYSREKLELIYQKTDGYCWYCDAKLAFTNHGFECLRGAWEVDHSVPRSRGGTSHMNNLIPVCYYCNREKGDMLGRTFRAYIERNWASTESYRAAMRRKYC